MSVRIVSGFVFGSEIDIDEDTFWDVIGDSELSLTENLSVGRFGDDCWTGRGDRRWLLFIKESVSKDSDGAMCRPIPHGYGVSMTEIAVAITMLEERGFLTRMTSPGMIYDLMRGWQYVDIQ